MLCLIQVGEVNLRRDHRARDRIGAMLFTGRMEINEPLTLQNMCRAKLALCNVGRLLTRSS
jgi:hypothetical protein